MCWLSLAVLCCLRLLRNELSSRNAMPVRPPMIIRLIASSTVISVVLFVLVALLLAGMVKRIGQNVLISQDIMSFLLCMDGCMISL